ncbi:MAG: energy transducer TonB [Bacteroidetes bacterium]|nr:energy transducer TonB [Bacteroidota bacterium]
MKHFFTCMLALIVLSIAHSPLHAQNSTSELPPVDAPHTIKEPSKQDSIYDRVELEASYPGGESAWRLFLERNLNGSIATDNKAPAGTYTVVVQFIIDKEGNVSEIKALTKHGYGMEDEVIRLLKKSPKWVPAQMNGRQVKVYRKQPVTFLVYEEEPRKKRRNRN